MVKQKTVRHFIMSAMLLLGVLITFSRIGLTAEASPGAAVKKVTSVNELTGNKTIKLAKGKKAYLKTTVTVMPNISKNKKVTYKSSNKRVATVTNRGVITGRKPGKAKITVTSVKNKKRKATVNVTVVKGKVTNIALNESSSQLKKGDSVKLKPFIKTSAGGSKAVVWTTSNKKVAKVNKQGKVTAVGNGNAYITVTAADGTWENASLYLTVKDYKLKYNYEVMFLNQPYDACSIIMYVKTNNPSAKNLNVELYTMEGKLENLWTSSVKGYEDLKDVGEKSGDFYKVKGGYLGQFNPFDMDSGKHRVKVEEHNAKGLSGYSNMGYIDVKDCDKERKEWMQSVIDQATTNSMTKKEKMEAITDYMYEHSVYLKRRSDDNKRLLYLAADVGIPSWKRSPYEFDSYTSPTLLVAFGDMIDYPLESLFWKYERGTPEWIQWHHVAKSVEDGSYYSFCPSSSSNIIDVSKIKQIDLSEWNFYKCYK